MNESQRDAERQLLELNTKLSPVILLNYPSGAVAENISVKFVIQIVNPIQTNIHNGQSEFPICLLHTHQKAIKIVLLLFIE